ncbi:MAG TPA: aldose 1-epimerase [Gaiellales bacterium]
MAEARRGPWAAIELGTPELAVTLLPEKGCDIVEVIDRRTGIDVLGRPPWGFGRRPTTLSSAERFIESYPGGWQVLLPNGGDAVAQQGTEWGFHGEAAIVPWSLDAHDATSARLSTWLTSAPLELEREIRVQARSVEVVERVRNAGGDAIDVMWGQHPAFGAPLIEPGARIETSARTFTADDRAPGAGLDPGARSSWPHASLADGGTLDLSVIPPDSEPRSILGYLSDFDEGAYTIANARLGLAVTLRWPLELYSHAWFWQELRALPGFPWFRRAYLAAIEPNTTIPGQGIERARARGGVPLTLAAGETREARLELVLSDRVA